MAEQATLLLRFTTAEVAAFFAQGSGLALADADVAALEQRTEGWAAALQLVALAIQAHPEHDEIIAALSGTHRFIVDYLTDEVLKGLPEHLQTFLLQTAMLERLCAPLCDALVLGDDAPLDAAYSQLVLDELERKNLFLIPLDGQWYRYHQLFRDVLRQRLVGGVRAVGAILDPSRLWRYAVMTQIENRQPLRTITLEEHYATPAFMDGPGRQIKDQAKAAHAHPQVAAGYTQLIEQLCDLGDRRIADMDTAGIDVQVLSLTSPGVEQLDATEAVVLARDANHRLADAVRRHPSRLAGFAALPTAAPDTAADELERMVRDHGFKGALINGHSQGRYLDDAFFWPILERAEALQVPLYLHPTPPPQPVIATSYMGNYAPEVAGVLATAA